MSPLFSVVIPTRNRSGLLRAAIASVLRQASADFELIVSDNDSSDDTRGVVQAFADSRVSYVSTGRYLPLSGSWEFATSHATGEWVWVLGDDDVMADDALATFQGVITDGSPEIITCGTVRYYAPSHPVPNLGRNVIHGRHFVDEVSVVPSRKILEAYFSLQVSVETLVPHPSAICISQKVVSDVRRRTGLFFHPPYPEFTAIPLALACTSVVRCIWRPLIIVGITSASWGSNVIFGDPVAAWRDVGEPFTRTPLKGRYFTNGVAECLLLAQEYEPERLKDYRIPEEQYYRSYLDQMRFQAGLGRDTRDDEWAFGTALADLPAELRSRLRWTLRRSAIAKTLRRLGLLRAAKALYSVVRRDRHGSLVVIHGDAIGVRDIETCARQLEGIRAQLVRQ